MIGHCWCASGTLEASNAENLTECYDVLLWLIQTEKILATAPRYCGSLSNQVTVTHGMSNEHSSAVLNSQSTQYFFLLMPHPNYVYCIAFTGLQAWKGKRIMDEGLGSFKTLMGRKIKRLAYFGANISEITATQGSSKVCEKWVLQRKKDLPGFQIPCSEI